MTSLKDRSKKAKTVFSLDTPSANFLHPQWPDIPSTTSTAILTKLLAFLTDIQELQSIQAAPQNDKPHILTGPNNVTAHLEYLVSLSRPLTIFPSASKTSSSAAITANPDKTSPRRPLAVFVTRSDQPSQLHSHLPILCSLSSTPLISLPKTSESKLASILKPKNGRVYMIIVFNDAPGIEDLKNSLLSDDGEALGKVDPPDVLKGFAWHETRSIAVKTFTGEPKKRKGAPASAGANKKKVKKGAE